MEDHAFFCFAASLRAASSLSKYAWSTPPVIYTHTRPSPPTYTPSKHEHSNTVGPGPSTPHASATPPTRRSVHARPLQVIQRLVQQVLGVDRGRHLARRHVVRDQLLRRGHVDAVHVAEAHRRRRRRHEHVLRSRLTDRLRVSTRPDTYLDQHARGVAAHDGVVHHQHRQTLHRVLVMKRPADANVDGVVLHADALLTHLLRGHDERARHVAVLRQTLDVLLAQRRRDLRLTRLLHAYRNGSVTTRVRHCHHHVDHLLQTRQRRVVALVALVHDGGALAVPQHAQLVNALRQTHAHLDTRLVHGDVVHHGVRTG